MKRNCIATILAICTLALALAGCSAPQPVQSVDEGSLVGFWRLDDSVQVGFDAVMNIDKEENLAELMIGDSYFEGTWSTDGKKATVTFDDYPKKAGNIFVSEDKLTLGQADGSKLVFKKGDMEAYFAEQEKAAAEEGSEGDDQVVELDDSMFGAEMDEKTIQKIDPVVAADSANVTVQVTGKGTDSEGDPGYVLSVKNKTSKAIYIESEDSYKVGGKSVEASASEIIDANSTVETFMFFPKEDLGGVDKLKDVTGNLTVGDDNTGESIETIPFKMK